ncbi:hypothetical protein DFP74_4708 [Nocardiopsis sp. Huas11]|nr:hypothetical protein DFP74_4708 [Nocardiopsis sp. Huas11]
MHEGAGGVGPREALPRGGGRPPGPNGPKVPSTPNVHTMRQRSHMVHNRARIQPNDQV